MKIKVAVEPVDFRKGIDGLAVVCRQVMASDPFCGQVFVFRNKRRTAIKFCFTMGKVLACFSIASAIFANSKTSTLTDTIIQA